MCVYDILSCHFNISSSDNHNVRSSPTGTANRSTEQRTGERERERGGGGERESMD